MKQLYGIIHTVSINHFGAAERLRQGAHEYGRNLEGHRPKKGLWKAGGRYDGPERGQLFPERRRICGHHGGLRLGQDHPAQLHLHHRHGECRRIRLDGQDITRLRPKELAKFRPGEPGFIFQDSNLLDTLTGFENIALALTVKGESTASIKPRVQAIARTLGVDEVLGKYPYQMSGGQKQRIAAARAMVADPKLVLADSPRARSIRAAPR